MSNTSKSMILKDVYQKLDGMQLSFGIPEFTNEVTDDELDKYFGIDYKDTLRELHLTSVDGIEEMSTTELLIENRVVYYALRRFRNSASVFFKFSTATDGKSVDKSMIPKMIFELIQEYDTEFKKARMGAVGTLWNRSGT